MPDSSQDSHSLEIRMLAHDLQGYINPQIVKVVLDVGSRDAKESISLKSLFPNATVYAFECNPPAIQLCEQNINGLADVILVAKAVSDVDGKVDFFSIDPQKTVTPHPDGNIGASSLFVANPGYPYEKYHQNKIIVDSITIEHWAAETGVGEIDIMWIDLQGAELKAFRGMGDLILRTKIIHTEVGFKEIYLEQPLFFEVDNYLTAKGFCLLRLYPSGWFGNALYIHRDFIGTIGLIVLFARKYLTFVRIWISRKFGATNLIG